MAESELDKAYRLFKAAARELEQVSSVSAEQLSERLRSVSHRVLDLLDNNGPEEPGGDIMSELERQSRDIATDLRRAERLMRGQSSEDD